MSYNDTITLHSGEQKRLEFSGEGKGKPLSLISGIIPTKISLLLQEPLVIVTVFHERHLLIISRPKRPGRADFCIECNMWSSG